MTIQRIRSEDDVYTYLEVGQQVTYRNIPGTAYEGDEQVTITEIGNDGTIGFTHEDGELDCDECYVGRFSVEVESEHEA